MKECCHSNTASLLKGETTFGNGLKLRFKWRSGRELPILTGSLPDRILTVLYRMIMISLPTLPDQGLLQIKKFKPGIDTNRASGSAIHWVSATLLGSYATSRSGLAWRRTIRSCIEAPVLWYRCNAKKFTILRSNIDGVHALTVLCGQV